MKIKNISAMEILDSRGNPTVMAKVVLDDNSIGSACVPSGASTGQFEAVELRDNGNRYMGKGVEKAVENINKTIAKELVGKEICCQRAIDDTLLKLDGTENKKKLGANATLAVSLAFARAMADSLNIPLYRYLGGINAHILPTPMLNIINGGAHAQNNIDIQEFMIFPNGFETFKEKIEASVNVYHTLKGLIKGGSGVGDEGGFAPSLSKDEEALDLICEAIETAGYKLKEQFSLCIDVASSDWFNNGSYTLPKSKKIYSADELLSYYTKLCNDYPIVSIEDPFGEEDWEAFQKITSSFKNKVQIVGDDLFVTNSKRLKKGIETGSANAILIKPNQIGTLSETLDAINLAKAKGYNTIISHRSGETADTFIADLSVAVNAGQIKTGAPARSERTEKYNRLLEIEAEINCC